MVRCPIYLNAEQGNNSHSRYLIGLQIENTEISALSEIIEINISVNIIRR